MSSSTKTGRKLRKRFKKELPFHLMLLPAVVMVVLFKYIPMAGLSIAFQDYSPLYMAMVLMIHGDLVFVMRCLIMLDMEQ